MPILKKASSIGTSLVAMFALGTYFTPAAQAETYNMSTKHLYFNGSLVSSPEGFMAIDSASHDYTTYIPIWYIQQLLKNSFGITQTWDGHNWQLTIPNSMSLGSFTGITPSSDSSKRVVWLNNKAFEAPTAITTTDPATGATTTYFPLWYIENVLKLLGVQDAWDGTNWTLTSSTTGTASGGQSSGNSTTSSGSSSGSANYSGTSSNSGSTTSTNRATTYGILNQPLQNAAADDSSWWARSNSQYYISAQTADPNLYTDPVSGSKILNVEPGQKLYLFAYSDKQDVNQEQTTWSTNSPDATITPDTSGWKAGSFQIAEAAFVASAPGVYTIQAKVNSSYSVPLVITVGLDKLQGNAINQSSDVMGIRPLPSGLTPQDNEDDGEGTKFTIYSLDGNWVPISGQTTTGSKFMTIIFGDKEAEPTWSYSIPVSSDGSFSAEVESPDSGQTDMFVFSNYLGDLTSLANGGQGVENNPTGVTLQMPSSAVTIPQSKLDLMPTAKMDYNLTPELNQIAATLYENSTSVKSGIEAINNYVSDLLIYDDSELQPNKYRFQDITTTLNSKTGVCEDYSEMEAAMFKSIGIRAETVSGTTPSSSKGDDPTTSLSSDDHEWLQAWDGQEWVVADPTWTSDDESNTAIVTNEFFTNTSSFQSSHITDASTIGDTFSKNQQR